MSEFTTTDESFTIGEKTFFYRDIHAVRIERKMNFSILRDIGMFFMLVVGWGLAGLLILGAIFYAAWFIWAMHSKKYCLIVNVAGAETTAFEVNGFTNKGKEDAEKEVNDLASQIRSRMGN